MRLARFRARARKWVPNGGRVGSSRVPEAEPLPAPPALHLPAPPARQVAPLERAEEPPGSGRALATTAYTSARKGIWERADAPKALVYFRVPDGPSTSFLPL